MHIVRALCSFVHSVLVCPVMLRRAPPCSLWRMTSITLLRHAPKMHFWVVFNRIPWSTCFVVLHHLHSQSCCPIVLHRSPRSHHAPTSSFSAMQPNRAPQLRCPVTLLNHAALSYTSIMHLHHTGP